MTEKPRKVEAILYQRNTCTGTTYILIDGKYYASDYIEAPSVAKELLGKRFLTKKFYHEDGTTRITLSDGQEFFHPSFAQSNDMVFDSVNKKFISMDVFDKMIEDIPLEGDFE